MLLHLTVYLKGNLWQGTALSRLAFSECSQINPSATKRCRKNIVRIIWRKVIFLATVPWNFQVLILNKLKEKGVNYSERHRMCSSPYYLCFKFSLKRPDIRLNFHSGCITSALKSSCISKQWEIPFAHTHKTNAHIKIQQSPNNYFETPQDYGGKLSNVKKCSSLSSLCILHSALFVHKHHDKI